MNALWHVALRTSLSAALLHCLATSVLAAPRVEMEVIFDARTAGLSMQQWSRTLTDLKVGGLRIRGSKPGDKLGIEVQGSGPKAVYKVTGMLNERSELLVPGGRFTLRDQAALGAWLKNLSEQGPPGAVKRLPFGLDETQLRNVNAALKPAVEFTTQGVSRSEALSAIGRQLQLPLVATGNFDAALQSAGPITDEMKGLSSGTVLAAVLRPAGLALAPRTSGRGQLELAIVKPVVGGDVWPVGLSADTNREQVLPRILTSINVEIDDNPLPTALAAIASRLETPLLYDHNGLAVERIEIDKVNVSLPATRLTYSLILRKLTGQAKLIAELRTDEAGKPFLWITPFRQSVQSVE